MKDIDMSEEINNELKSLANIIMKFNILSTDDTKHNKELKAAFNERGDFFGSEKLHDAYDEISEIENKFYSSNGLPRYFPDDKNHTYLVNKSNAAHVNALEMSVPLAQKSELLAERYPKWMKEVVEDLWEDPKEMQKLFEKHDAPNIAALLAEPT